MEIWVNLEFGDGNFDQGFGNINVKVTPANAQGYITQREVQLPPSAEIPVSYQCWKEQYYSLLNNSRGGFKNSQVTHISQTDCYHYAGASTFGRNTEIIRANISNVSTEPRQITM